MKIAFLFLTLAGIHHEAYWQDFFEGHEDNYSIYVHSKNGVPATSFFKQYQIKNIVPTSWRNTMKAQIVLLQEALKDPSNAKFVFLSETTIPLQSFENVYEELTKHEKSMFCFWPNPHINKSDRRWYNFRRRHHGVDRKLEYKNWQWVVLNREHAQMMVVDKHWLNVICAHPFDNEHYPSMLLAIHGLLHAVAQKDTTYACWSAHNGQRCWRNPYLFTNLNIDLDYNLVKEKIAEGFLFARKFAPNCDLAPLDSLLAYRCSKP